MTKYSFIVDFIICILTLLPCTLAIDITDIAIVHGGSENGGCDRRVAALDQWLTESIFSVEAAVDAVENYSEYVEVRRSMAAFFGIKNDYRVRQGSDKDKAIKQIKVYLSFALKFLEHATYENGTIVYDREDHWLFCDSTFLSQHSKTDPAFDLLGNEIVDQNNKVVKIMDVRKYQEELAGDSNAKPWWSGELTSLKGYWFTEDGGNYCNTNELGATAAMQLLGQDARDVNEDEGGLAAIILCPYSFDTSPRPDSYNRANQMITHGRNLADVVPKSATLLHEVFHAIFGDAFLAGDREIYDIASCLNTVSNPEQGPRVAQRNPENYVFFVAHMYHLFGQKDGEKPWSISENWDFKILSVLGDRVFGAKSKG